MESASHQAPLVVIVGETASGKSQLALEIAQMFDGEIISADSWQVYKGFDIGTAKPSADERRKVKHHLIDVADPKQGFSAPEFKKLTQTAIDDIAARGKLPIMVGGTGLYIDSVLYDFNFLPPGEPKERQRLNDLSLVGVLTEAEVAGIDLSGIDQRNKRRVIRAIESGGIRPAAGESRTNTLVIGLLIQREQLRERVMQRIDKMFEQGLETEVAGLAKHYGWDVEPMKGIGYQQWREYFVCNQTLDQTRQQIIKATLDLAKRQRTWFKRNNSIHWVSQQREVVDLITTFLNK